ncbi:MAG: hypothetical protein ACP5D8_04910 [Fidelibacterota bacterium]
MKKNLISTMLLGTLVLIFSGCSTLMDIYMTGTSPMTPVTERAERRVGLALMDATGLGAMQAGMMATTLYMQVFLAGGYAGGYEDFTEGQGVVWEVISQDQGERESLEIERAFLKELPDGSQWWLLRYSANGETILSEALMDTAYQLKKFRYRDPEYNQIREWTPQYETETSETVETEEGVVTEETQTYAAKESYSEAMNVNDYSPYVLRTESITVPAGTFDAKYARFEAEYEKTDPDTGEPTGDMDKIIYEWWISEEVPGNMVRYAWSNPSEGVSLTGHLKSITTYQNSQLGSY